MSDKKTLKSLEASYIPLILAAIVTIGVIYLVFGQTQEILKERLRQRLISIAATAALQFSPEEVRSVRSEEDLDNPALESMTQKMQSIRSSNENLIYIYILRPSGKANTLIFVADADMLASLEELDINENGVVDEDEAPPSPGEEYDVSDIPQLLSAFQGATADQELNTDKWGTFLSGYAPIFDEEGNSIAVLGVDVQVDDFYVLVRATFIPFLLLTLLLLALLSSQTVVLIRIWKNRVEVVKELDRQKDELLSIVSHQLATPVSSVKWYIEMLLEGDMGKLSKTQSDHVNTMYSVVAGLVELVRMILDVSRIQLGKMKIDKSEVQLIDFFKKTVDVLQPKAEEKSVEFVKKIPKNLGSGMIDVRLTKMVVENLLSNAIKYTPKGGTVELDVKVINNVLHCSVSDTGCGIPIQDQSKIFGKLFRASNVSSVDGNGFGLYIAKGAIESQGGSIGFVSKENEGTTFSFTLPLKN